MSRRKSYPSSASERHFAVLRSLVSRSSRAGSTNRTALPELTNLLGQRCANHIDAYWDRPAQDGPIDVIDMFSGCGGMSSGFVALNGVVPAFKIVAAVDIDRVANATYEANLGLKPLELDVSVLARSGKRLDELTSARRPGHPLVLIGCAPCQGFSSHRNAGGSRDDRNPLFLDFARIAAKLEPDVVVVENVPELLTERYWLYVEKARRILERAGYYVYVGVHNMAEFGVPQERFRALMLAMRHPFRPPASFVERARFRTVRQVIGHLPKVKAGEHIAGDLWHYSARHSEATISVIRAVPHDGGNRPMHVGPACLRRIAKRQGKAAYEDVYGRLRWDRPSITITAYSRNPASGRFCHPEQDRGLSIREAALIQGFPKKYEFAGSLDDCFRQIGNAVPPVFAASVAAHVLGELLGPHDAPGFSAGMRRPVGVSFSRLIPSLKARRMEAYSPA